MSSWIQRREGTSSLLALMRPPINALDWEVLNELTGAVEKVEADRETRVLVITSGIEGIFCSGGDLNFWRQVRDGKEVSRAGREVFAWIERLPKPTIAAINGHVIGDGLNLALACDLRIASEAATIRLPEAAYGFIPGWGLIQASRDLDRSVEYLRTSFTRPANGSHTGLDGWPGKRSDFISPAHGRGTGTSPGDSRFLSHRSTGSQVRPPWRK